MRDMADQVVARCVEHITSLPNQPLYGVHGAEALCERMRESSPASGTPLPALLDSATPGGSHSDRVKAAPAPPRPPPMALPPAPPRTVAVTVQPVAASSLVRIRFSGTSPEWAQRISAAIAENYERSTLDRRFGASQHARNFLDERLQQLKIKLQDSEKQLIAYAQREGIVEIDDKKQSINPILAGLQGALSTAVTERVKAEQFWLQVQAIDGLELPQIWPAP
jgi:uncharacterized protein involved in exopolysaccharide biosynthesis